MRRTSLLKLVATLAIVVAASLSPASAATNGAAIGDLKARFMYLSTNGNSNCSASFMKSIAKMPPTARLQGSCCSPMVLDRYIEQVRGLRKYAKVREIPPDPYDIDAGRAQTMMAAYSIKLSEGQQVAYIYAMRHSEEKGPCCCKCWRWQAYGGLAKLLIRDHGFTGPQVTDVWNLSDGCGGNG